MKLIHLQKYHWEPRYNDIENLQNEQVLPNVMHIQFCFTNSLAIRSLFSKDSDPLKLILFIKSSTGYPELIKVFYYLKESFHIFFHLERPIWGLESWERYCERSNCLTTSSLPKFNAEQGRDFESTLLYHQYWDIPISFASDTYQPLTTSP